MTQPDPDRDRGLYAKYEVRKRVREIDQRGEEVTVTVPVTNRVFVLNPDRDKHAVDALQAYAASCRDTYPLLARDLLTWVTDVRSR
jgi:hypothetical protein